MKPPQTPLWVMSQATADKLKALGWKVPDKWEIRKPVKPEVK